MHFYMEKGKQRLDLTGNLILTVNENLVAIRSSSAGPRIVEKPHYLRLRGAKFKGKMLASIIALKFIWKPPASNSDAKEG